MQGVRERFKYLLCVSSALLHDRRPPDLLSAGLLPVVSVGVNQAGRLNLGRQGASLRCFALYGLQEGYQPFAVNMAREPPLWMSWRQPQFTSILPHHRDLMVSLHGDDVWGDCTVSLHQQLCGWRDVTATRGLFPIFRTSQRLVTVYILASVEVDLSI